MGTPPNSDFRILVHSFVVDFKIVFDCIRFFLS